MCFFSLHFHLSFVRARDILMFTNVGVWMERSPDILKAQGTWTVDYFCPKLRDSLTESMNFWQAESASPNSKSWRFMWCPSFALSPPKTVARELKEMSYYCLLWILHDLMNLAASLSVSSKNCSSGIERDELLMLAVNFAWSYESCSFALSPPILMIITTLVRIDLCI
jgi:hypothetical protein